MAKKFGKFLLGAAVIGGAAAAAYMYLQKKGVVSVTPENVDEDYDDFSEEEEECPARNYVSLTKDTEKNEAEECICDCVTEECADEESAAEECVAEECAAEPDTVEEFFDEEKPEE